MEAVERVVPSGEAGGSGAAVQGQARPWAGGAFEETPPRAQAGSRRPQSAARTGAVTGVMTGSSTGTPSALQWPRVHSCSRKAGVAWTIRW